MAFFFEPLPKVRRQGSGSRREAKYPTAGPLVLDHFRHLLWHLLLRISASEDVGRQIQTD